MKRSYAGNMTIGGGANLSYISVDGESVVVSATAGGVLQGAATLDSSNPKAKLCEQGVPGSGIPSVEVAFASEAQVTVKWTLSWAGMPSGSTTSGILAGWSA
jgi:hypothetical protein